MEKDLNQVITIEEINSSMYESVTAMSDESVNQALEVFHKTLTEEIQNPSEYYLLYGRSMSYFTVLKLVESSSKSKEDERIDKVLKECLTNMGEIYDFETRIEDDNVVCEIWVKKFNKEKVECLMLFNFDVGVEEVWSH